MAFAFPLPANIPTVSHPIALEYQGSDLGVFIQTLLNVMLSTHIDDSVRLSLFPYFLEQS